LRTFYDSLKELSDQNLLDRINRKEHFQKESVLASYNILKQRGYDLENPFPDENDSFLETRKKNKKSSFLEREYHVWLKMVSKNQPIGLLILFAILFFILLLIFSSYLKNTDLFRRIHLSSQTIIAHGGITYIIEIILVFVLFISSRKKIDTFLKVRSKHIFIALKVFIFSLVILSALEWLFGKSVTIIQIADDKTPREFLKNLWFGGLVAFTEELIFKWLLLTQLLLRVGNTASKRRSIFFIVAILFAACHIPGQLSDGGEINIGHLIKIFLYSYFTSILYVKFRNFPLVVLLHFLVNISVIFIESGDGFYTNWAFTLVGIYCIPKINKSWLFKSKLKYKIPKWAFGSLILGLTCIVLLSEKKPKDHFNVSRQYHFMGSEQKALGIINKSLSKEPENPKFYNHRGNIYFSLNLNDSAWHDYDMAVQYDPQFYQAISNRGIAAKYISNYEGCIEDLTIAIDKHYESSRVYLNRGNCYLGISEPKLALLDFEEALKKDKYNKRIYYGLGRSYLKLKDFKKASENLEHAIELDIAFVEAYEVLSMAYHGLERYDSSNAIITRAIEMGSSNPSRFFIKGLNFYQNEDYFKAIIEFEKSIELKPEDSRLFLNLAHAHFFLDNYTKGCDYLNTSAWLGNDEAKKDLNFYCDKSYR
jgi:tetratricopeptide (TPR) repeat protein